MMFFALDGFAKLLLQELREKNHTANFKDLEDYLAETYSVPRGYGEYLEMCYDKRTVLVHPMNYTTHWSPPLDVEDLGETGTVIQDLAWVYVTGFAAKNNSELNPNEKTSEVQIEPIIRPTT